MSGDARGREVGRKSAARGPSGTLRLLSVVGVLSVVAVPGGRASAQEGASVFDFPDRMWVVDGIEVPSVADTFALTDVRRWPRLELGFSLQYATPLSNSADLNLYVYPIPGERRGLDETQVIEPEFESAVQGIFDYNVANRAGATVTVDVREETFLSLSNGETVRGMRAEGAFERSGARRPTFLYVFAKEDRYLKYRISFDAQDRDALEEHVKEWIRSTYEAIGPPPGSWLP